MSESGRQSPHQPLIGTSFSQAGASRPFLNLLNPIGRHYHGYTPAGLLQEDDDQDDNGEDEGTPTGSAYKSRLEQVPLDDLQATTTRRDRITNESSDDDEVPQSFLIEANATPVTHPHRPERPASTKPTPQKLRASKHPPPVLPTHNDASHHRQDSQDIGRDAFTPKPFQSGLNDKERALWNWVNVYNLDAYLQDVSF